MGGGGEKEEEEDGCREREGWAACNRRVVERQLPVQAFRRVGCACIDRHYIAARCCCERDEEWVQ